MIDKNEHILFSEANILYKNTESTKLYLFYKIIGSNRS